MKVQEASPEAAEGCEAREIVNGLLGGTPTMRQAGAAYLPRQPAEDSGDWEYRVGVATLFPAFERTLNVMSAKPFSKQIVLGPDVPQRMRPWLEDVDLQGNSLHSFAAEVFPEVLSKGMCGVLVDYPRLRRSRVRTLADERKLNARPYCVFIRRDQILGWMKETTNGQTRLTMLRFSETAEVPDGEFGVRVVNRVRVLRPGLVEVWEESADDKNKYVAIDRYNISLKEIPFTAFYGKKKGFMCGVSPLQNLAYLNVEHWQESSDQKDSTRFARKRLLAIIGAQVAGDIVVASNFSLNLPQGGDAKILQGSAESVRVGRSEIDVLEDHMVQAGAELLIQKPGIRTATEASNDAEANKSDLQRIVEMFEDGLDQVLQWMAQWSGERQGGHVTLFKDFGIFGFDEAAETLLLNAANAGSVSNETFFNELKRRGTVDPAIEWPDEQARIAAQPPRTPPAATLPRQPVPPQIDETPAV